MAPAEPERGGGAGRGVPDPVVVFLYGDYGCPFTYLTDRRLELLGRERPLEVRWRPLYLGPGARPVRGAGVGTRAGRREASEEAAGGLWEDVRRELEEAAAELDLPLRFPAAPVDSRESLQAAEFARDVGEACFRRLHRALFRAVFAEGLDLGDRPTLLSVAEGAGLDGAALEGALQDARYEGELVAAREEAERYRITGTPGLLVGRFLLIGAAPLEELRRTAERAVRATC